MPESRELLERVFREESGVVVAALVAQLHDLDLAEDSFADAVAAALETWPASGAPARPGAWLLTTARRKALDRLRRRATRIEKQRALELEAELAHGAAESPEEDESPIPDERLRLIFTCCDPALSRQAQVALTLKTLGGLGTAETARAFLVDEPAMARRLVRAKARLREIGARYRVPEVDELPARCEVVLAVIYLIFNEGYAASAGDALVRRELCREAIRLARALTELLPGRAEIVGLLALMLLHDSRRDARVDAAGTGVPLEEQDRASWDHAQIAGGLALLDALDERAAGPYELQARIAAEHVRGARFADTDWRRIVALYDRLLALQGSPVIALSRAVAVGLAESPDAGLALLDDPELAKALAGYPPLAISRADLLRRAGRTAEARAAYREALAEVATAPERAFLERRLAELETGVGRRVGDGGVGDGVGDVD
jgi:RNA polymerase sigma-70 factor (ECF subfamily)